jgi:biotin carboxyl carrier protein
VAYNLCQVQSLLKDAYERAKQQIKDNMTKIRGEASLGRDIGHDQALKQAIFADIKTLHGDTPDEYELFVRRAIYYLFLRGISSSALHKTARKMYYYYIRGHNEIETDGPGQDVQVGYLPLTVAEEALVYVGIPLAEPSTKRSVDAGYGSIRAPVTGKVVTTYVTGKDRGPVEPGNTLFVLEEWITPSMKREVNVVAEVGGQVGKVMVKVGDWVDKDKTELMRVQDPWVSIGRALPCPTL